MIYVLDTNIFREMISHLPKKGKHFEKIWDTIESKISNGEIISVDECYNELERHYSSNAEQYPWIHDHKDMFKCPGNQESVIINQLFQNSKMRETVHQKNILSNRPSADIYLIAKARILGATIVTKEKRKPNSAQLPNLCDELGISVISYEDFMAYIDQ